MSGLWAAFFISIHERISRPSCILFSILQLVCNSGILFMQKKGRKTPPSPSR